MGSPRKNFSKGYQTVKNNFQEAVAICLRSNITAQERQECVDVVLCLCLLQESKWQAR